MVYIVFALVVKDSCLERKIKMELDLYARVSTKHQDIDQQMDYLRSWCKRNGHIIRSETWDTQSGRIELENREKFMELLKTPKGQALLVFKLDRLTRNYDSCALIEKHFRENWENYRLVATDFPVDLGTATGRLMFRNLMALNCFEPELMLERQEIGIARAKAEGKFKGRPKGYKNKKNRLEGDKGYVNAKLAL